MPTSEALREPSEVLRLTRAGTRLMLKAGREEIEP